MSTLTMHFLQRFTDIKFPIRHVFISVSFSAIVWLGGLTPSQAQTYRIDGEGFALADNGITVVCDDAEVGDTARLEVGSPGFYVLLRVLTKIESKSSLETFGGEYSPLTVCTSGLTDLSGALKNTSIDDVVISTWDVSSVTNMTEMFMNATDFDQDLSVWDVSSVTDMSYMFQGASTFDNGGEPLTWTTSGSLLNIRNMFKNAVAFNQRVGSWDVSNVTNMQAVFNGASSFNRELRDWNVAKVENMQSMFGPGPNDANPSVFNKDISGWDVSSVTTMKAMFKMTTVFNQDISKWNVSSVTDMDNMFYGAENFNKDLSGWCVSKISSEPEGFATDAPLANANKPVWGTCPGDETNSDFYLHDNSVTVMCPDAEVGESGEVGGVTYTKRTKDQITPDNAAKTCTSGINDMSEMFYAADAFNQDISSWDVSSVTDMQRMFQSSSFNKPIEDWDVSSVTNMNRMFHNTSFSQDISSWDVSSVTDMERMFYNSSFNKPIEDWDVSSVLNMKYMFAYATNFNQDLGGWDVSSVLNMESMFFSASAFNQDIGSWDVSSVTNMIGMFYYANNFNQDLSDWCVSKISSEPEGFAINSQLTNANKPVWRTCPGFEEIPTLGEVEVSSVTGDGATISSRITDKGNDRISKKGFLYSSTDSTLNSGTVDLEVKGSLSQELIGLEGNTTYWVRSYARNTAGVGYSEIVSFTTRLQLSDDFYLHDNDVTVMCPDADVGDVGEIKDVRYTKRSKGQITTGNASTTCTSGITDMSYMFKEKSFNQDIGSWDVSSVTNMNSMFVDADAFNQDISSWDVSSVKDMAYMFKGTDAFNQDIRSWDVSSVTDMTGMFWLSSFNQDIGDWDVSSVKDMAYMFYGTDAFNQDIRSWDVSSVTNMIGMFWLSSFNQDIGDWDVSSVKDMGGMFAYTPFNQDIRSWDVSSVKDMGGMFVSAVSFNQDLSEWCVPNVTQYAQFDYNSGLNEDYLPLWERCPVSQVTLRGPAHEAANQPLSQTFSWVSDARAETYTLEVSTDEFASSPLVDETLDASDTTYALSDLTYETTYEWRVRAANSTGIGHKGEWSDSRSFTTRSAPTPDQPGRPTLSSPTDGATGQSTSLSVNWNEAARATSYTVQVSDDNFSNLDAEETVSGTSASITGLAYETTYKWRVIGNNQAGQGDWSPTWSFSTEGTPAPGQVTLSAPADGATGQSYQPTLSWQSVPYASTYQVQVSANGFSTTLVDQTTSSTQFQVSVDFNSTYEWRVRASNNAGEGPWSETRSFSTRDVPPPGGVTLKAPADGSTGVILPATLQWEATNYASSYDIELRAGGTAVENTTSSSNTVEIQLEYETTYSWRVKARNANGASSWSESWSFSTAEGLVDSITVIAPKDGAANVSTSPELSWQAASNAAEYHLEVSDDAFATTMLTTTLVGNTSHQLSGLEHNHTYHWRLRGANETGNGPWTPTMSFKTQAPSTAAPTLLSPAQNAQDVEIPTVFTWEADPNATAYEIELFTDALLTTVFSFDVTDTTYTYGEMEAQKDYLFRVRAKNASGTSNWANVEFKTGDADEVGTSNESWGEGLPRRFGLEQNYPNPFNPSTVIRYAVPQASQVRLMVFDMMGREVATLARGTKSAGYHEVVFDASHLGSGAYMYRLEAGDVVLARTLYLIK